MKLLLAEDEKEYCRALCAMLERSHYSVDCAHDGAAALELILSGHYDAIILDIMMPKMDGLEVLRRLREAGVGTPVMLLTARTRMDDRISGYDAGADDYLPKPFHADEFLARVRALLRRRPTFIPDVLSFSGISIDGSTNSLRGPLGEEKLTGKEYQMLELLIRSPGKGVSTDMFMEKVWGAESLAETNVVWVHMSSLRKKLAAVSAEVEIHAQRGVGYLLETEERP